MPPPPPPPPTELHVLPMVAWMAIVAAFAVGLGALAGSVPGLIVAGLVVLSGVLLAYGYRSTGRRRTLAVVGAILIASSAVVVVALPAEGARAHLDVEKFAIQDPSAVDADVSNASVPTEQPTPATVNTNLLDVTLRNTGTVAAFISKAEITVRYAKQLKNCEHSGGEARISAEYSFKVPLDISTGQVVDRDISFDVGAGAVDRLAFSIGPVEQSGSSAVPWLYVVDLRLKYSDSDEYLDVGSAALLARPGDGERQLKAGVLHGDYECLEQNSEVISGAIALTNNASAELLKLSADHTKALGSDGEAPAQEVCTPATDSSGALSIQESCFKLSHRRLTAHIRLSQNEIPEGVQIVFKISSSDPTANLRWAALFIQGEWRVGFVEPDGPSAPSGTGCGICSVNVDGATLELTSSTGDSLRDDESTVVHNLDITSIELQDATDRSAPVITQQVKAGLPVRIIRGG